MQFKAAQAIQDAAAAGGGGGEGEEHDKGSEGSRSHGWSPSDELGPL